MEGLLLTYPRVVSSERTRLEPPTPTPGGGGGGHGALAGTPTKLRTPRMLGKKREREKEKENHSPNPKSLRSPKSPRTPKSKKKDKERERERSARKQTTLPHSSPPPSPTRGLSALAATALALANAHPTPEADRKAEKARRKEEKRRRREEREREKDLGEEEPKEKEKEKEKKKRKHRDEVSTPARGADPATPTPKRRKREVHETPFTGPSRSAADVSMAALLASNRKNPGSVLRPSGRDMSVSSLLVTPRPVRAEEKRSARKSDKKKRRDKDGDRTVENTMNLSAVLATPGMPMPPSTPGFPLDSEMDIPDTDPMDVDDDMDDERRARRKAEKAARRAERAKRKAEKAERRAMREREKEEKRIAEERRIAEEKRIAEKKAAERAKAMAQAQARLVAESSSDSDSDSDDEPPARTAPKAQPDLTDILRGRPRQVPAPAPAAAEKSKEKSTTRKVAASAAATTTRAPRASASEAVTTRAPRRKSAANALSQAEQDEQLRKELADEAIMHEFLASKWIEIKELQRLEAAGVLRYKRGRFSEDERSALREWLDTFRRTNRLTEDALLEIIMAKGKAGERSQYPKFYSDLAGQVPGRPVRYVKEAVKRMYDPRARKGAWTKEEDAGLLQAYQLHPNEWTKIAALVDRSESDCRDRWRGELKGHESRVSGAWSQEETDALIAAVTEANRRLGMPATAPDTPWQVVVDLMGGTRSLTQCRKKWQDTLLPDLKANEARQAGTSVAKTMVSRRDLLERLRALDVRHERDLSWTRVVPPEWDIKPGTLRGVWHRMKHSVPGWDGMPFPQLLDEIEKRV